MRDLSLRQVGHPFRSTTVQCAYYNHIPCCHLPSPPFLITYLKLRFKYVNQLVYFQADTAWFKRFISRNLFKTSKSWVLNHKTIVNSYACMICMYPLGVNASFASYASICVRNTTQCEHATQYVSFTHNWSTTKIVRHVDSYRQGTTQLGHIFYDIRAYYVHVLTRD